MRWTEAQSDAIGCDVGDLLVAAGAGAGKTGVLTERVVRKVVTGQCSITELLVVTFTESAAAEMRARIAAKLADARQQAHARGDRATARAIERQIVLLEAGAVCTLHSFASKLLHEHFHHLGLDPAFEVLDEDESKLVRQEVLDELLEEHYADDGQAGADFRNLLEWCAPGGGDAAVRRTVLSLYDKAASLPRPDDWWREVDEALDPRRLNSLFESAWGESLAKLFELETEAAASRLELARALIDKHAELKSYAQAAENLADGLAELRQAFHSQMRLADLNATLGKMCEFRLPPIKNAPPAKAEAQAMLTGIRDAMRQLRQIASSDEKESLAALSSLGPVAGTLAKLVRRFEADYSQAKRARSQLDFNDLERFAFRLLTEIEPVRTAVAGQFREVLVDEYQDISPVQDAMLQAVAGAGRPHAAKDAPTRLFRVGDLKQSIYRFRLAEPNIFLDVLARFGGGDGGKLVCLSDNFRSRRTILEAVNAVFARLMKPLRTLLDGAAGPAYDEQARLRFAAPAYAAKDAPPDAPVELLLLADQACEEKAGEDDEQAQETPDGDERARLERTRLQARLIGLRIKDLLGLTLGSAPAQVWDEASNRFRPAQPKDIVILLRTASNVAPKLVEELAAMGVPAHAEVSAGYFGQVEVRDIRALLAIIDNPRQDLPLAAVLRSPLMQFTAEQPAGQVAAALAADELAAVRLACPAGKQFIDAVRSAAENLNLDPGLRARLQKFLDQLDRWRTTARRRPLSELLADIYRVTNYPAYVCGLRGGGQRKANLADLARRARQFDSFARQGLARFARFLDELEAAGEDLGMPGALTEADDVVRVMTIHRAKGLEFPIVITADLEHRFNLADTTCDVLFHRRMLLGLRCLDREHAVRYPSLPHVLINRQLKMEDLLEEMRLLYVAMTRARERLILVGSQKKLAETMRTRWAAPADDADLLQVGNRLDWLAPAVLGCVSSGQTQLAVLRQLLDGPLDQPGQAGNEIFRITVYQSACLARVLAQADEEAEAAPAWRAQAALGGPLPDDGRSLTPPEQTVLDSLAERFAFRYPFASTATMRAKLSVTELKNQFETRAEADEQTPPPAPAGPAADDPRAPPWSQPEQPDALSRGTATHAVLQRLDLSRPLDQAAEVVRQAEAMAAMLLPLQPEVVDAGAIACFFAGEIGQAMRANPDRVRREWAFSLAVPAEEIRNAECGKRNGELNAGDLQPDRILVQGMIDALIELADGSLAVLDFKTDAVSTEAEIATRAAAYATQLHWYARAAQTILGKPVTRKLLYFLHPGRLLEL